MEKKNERETERGKKGEKKQRATFMGRNLVEVIRSHITARERINQRDSSQRKRTATDFFLLFPSDAQLLMRKPQRSLSAAYHFPGYGCREEDGRGGRGRGGIEEGKGRRGTEISKRDA